MNDNRIILEIFHIPFKKGDNFLIYSRNKKEYVRPGDYPFLTEYLNGFAENIPCWSTLEKCLDNIKRITSNKNNLNVCYSISTKVNLIKLKDIFNLVETAVIRRKSELLNNRANPYKMSPSDKRKAKKFLLQKIKLGIISPFDIQTYIDQKFIA